MGRRNETDKTETCNILSSGRNRHIWVCRDVEQPVSRDNPIIPRLDPLAPAKSDIFALEFDLPAQKLRVPSQTLKPLFSMQGYSTQPSVSSDGKNVGFLNRRSTAGRSRFNLVLTNWAGEILKYVEASGSGFSQPAIVENHLYANELLEGRYVVRTFNLSDLSPQVLLELNYSAQALRDLEQKSLRLEN